MPGANFMVPINRVGRRRLIVTATVAMLARPGRSPALPPGAEGRQFGRVRARAGTG